MIRTTCCLAALIAGLALFAGCDSATPPSVSPPAADKDLSGSIIDPPVQGTLFEADLQVGYVQILREAALPTGDGYLYELDVYYGLHAPLAGSADRRNLTIRYKPTSGGITGGYTATLKDVLGNLLWEAEETVDPANSNHFSQRQATASDERIREWTIGAASIQEVFTFNGTSLALDYPTGDLVHVLDLQAQLVEGTIPPITVLEPGATVDEEIIFELSRILEIYTFESTLHGNPEGDLVEEFLDSSAIGDWLAARHPGEDHGLYYISDEVCLSAVDNGMKYCDPDDPSYNEWACDLCIKVLFRCLAERLFAIYN